MENQCWNVDMWAVWKGNKEAAVKTDEGEGPPLIARAMWMGTGPRLGKPSWFSTIFLQPIFKS